MSVLCVLFSFNGICMQWTESLCDKSLKTSLHHDFRYTHWTYLSLFCVKTQKNDLCEGFFVAHLPCLSSKFTKKDQKSQFFSTLLYISPYNFPKRPDFKFFVKEVQPLPINRADFGDKHRQYVNDNIVLKLASKRRKTGEVAQTFSQNTGSGHIIPT